LGSSPHSCGPIRWVPFFLSSLVLSSPRWAVTSPPPAAESRKILLDSE
jgi:hypothetical protein